MNYKEASEFIGKPSGSLGYASLSEAAVILNDRMLELEKQIKDDTGYREMKRRYESIVAENKANYLKLQKAEAQRDDLLDTLIGIRKALEEQTTEGRPSKYSASVTLAIGKVNAAIIHTTGKTWEEIQTKDVTLEENNTGGKS